MLVLTATGGPKGAGLTPYNGKGLEDVPLSPAKGFLVLLLLLKLE